MVLLLAACIPGGGFERLDYGVAVLFAAGERPVDVEIAARFDVDCVLLEHPALAMGIDYPESTPLQLEPGYPQAPFDDGYWNAESYRPCMAAWIGLPDGRGTSMVYDMWSTEQAWDAPIDAVELSWNTVLVDPDRDPPFTDGNQGAVGVAARPTPPCEPVLPAWQPIDASGTVLSVEQVGTCSILGVSDGNTVELCDGPAFPYLVGEDVIVHASSTQFYSATNGGGKQVEVGLDGTRMPRGVSIAVDSDPGAGTVVDGDACALEDPCGPAIAQTASIDGAPLARADWGTRIDVRAETGESRVLRVYQAGVPVDHLCPIALAWSTEPAP